MVHPIPIVERLKGVPIVTGFGKLHVHRPQRDAVVAVGLLGLPQAQRGVL